MRNVGNLALESEDLRDEERADDFDDFLKDMCFATREQIFRCLPKETAHSKYKDGLPAKFLRAFSGEIEGGYFPVLTREELDKIADIDGTKYVCKKRQRADTSSYYVATLNRLLRKSGGSIKAIRRFVSEYAMDAVYCLESLDPDNTLDNSKFAMPDGIEMPEVPSFADLKDIKRVADSGITRNGSWTSIFLDAFMKKLFESKRPILFMSEAREMLPAGHKIEQRVEGANVTFVKMGLCIKRIPSGFMLIKCEAIEFPREALKKVKEVKPPLVPKPKKPVKEKVVKVKKVAEVIPVKPARVKVEKKKSPDEIFLETIAGFGKKSPNTIRQVNNEIFDVFLVLSQTDAKNWLQYVQLFSEAVTKFESKTQGHLRFPLYVYLNKISHMIKSGDISYEDLVSLMDGLR